MSASDAENPKTDARSSENASSTGKTVLKILAVLVVVAGLVLLGRQAGGYVEDFARWVDGLGVWGPVVFIAGYVVAVVAFVPGSILTLAAGALFGLVEGTLYVICAATVGAGLAFLISRYLARRWVENKLENSDRFETIDRAVGEQGFKIVALLRLSPIFPFNLLNYALGLTKVRFLDYLLASVGMLPGTFLYVYYGKAAGDLAALSTGSQQKGTGDWVVLGLGLVATVIVTAIVTRIARRALKEKADV